MRRARYALAFLTRLPGGAHPPSSSELASATPWFPAVGLVVGAISALVWLAGNLLLPSLPAALLAVAAGVVASGAFHEDGLADTADALGGSTREQRLAIMRDSRIGTFGGLALVLTVALRSTALAALGGGTGAIALLAAHGLGRGISLLVLLWTPGSRRDGLGVDFREHLPRRTTAAAGAATVLAVGLPSPAGALAVTAATLAVLGLTLLARRLFGGVSGDVVGAAEQLTEVAVLCAVAAMVPQRGWSW